MAVSRPLLRLISRLASHLSLTAPGPFDGPGRVASWMVGFEVAWPGPRGSCVDSRGLVQPRVTGLRPGFAQGLELGLPVERVQGHARALPLPAAPLVGLLPAGLGSISGTRSPRSSSTYSMRCLSLAQPPVAGRSAGWRRGCARADCCPPCPRGWRRWPRSVRVQVLADVLLQRLHALPGGELARQATTIFLAGLAVRPVSCSSTALFFQIANLQSLF